MGLVRRVGGRGCLDGFWSEVVKGRWVGWVQATISRQATALLVPPSPSAMGVAAWAVGLDRTRIHFSLVFPLPCYTKHATLRQLEAYISRTILRSLRIVASVRPSGV